MCISDFLYDDFNEDQEFWGVAAMQLDHQDDEQVHLLYCMQIFDSSKHMYSTSHQVMYTYKFLEHKNFAIFYCV